MSESPLLARQLPVPGYCESGHPFSIVGILKALPLATWTETAARRPCLYRSCSLLANILRALRARDRL